MQEKVKSERTFFFFVDLLLVNCFWAFAKLLSFLTSRKMSGEKGVRSRILARREASF